MKIVTLQSKDIKLQIWDSAGQPKFRAITRSFYKGANGIILVYDVNNTYSYDNIRNWNKMIEQNTQKSTKTILIGNKIDIAPDKSAATEKCSKLAEELNLNYFLTSAKDNINIDETFTSLIEQIIKGDDKNPAGGRLMIEKEDKLGKKEKKKCCGSG